MGRTIELDLLIVGGGVQGLTLLHEYADMHPGGSVLLVSRDPLGKGETLHSHGYLHRGYFVPPESSALIGRIVESFDWWNRWLERRGIRYAETQPLLFDLTEEHYQMRTGIWRAAGLPFEPVDRLPDALEGGSYSRPDHGRRLVRIHDRLIPAWRIIETMSRPLQHSLMRGELTGISCDPGTRRVVECSVGTPDGEVVRFRPRYLVLATGVETQRLVTTIAGRGDAPWTPNRIRDVPMLLIRGASLPALSGWFFVERPVTIVSHPLDDGERMWVVTPMEDHRTSREDFVGRAGTVDAATVRNTLRALHDMVPALNRLSSGLRWSSYLGPKIDHPDGVPTWVTGDAGFENLRFVWPVLWGLAYGAAREVLRTVPEPVSSRPAAGVGLPTGVEVGDEHRLSASLEWRPVEPS